MIRSLAVRVGNSGMVDWSGTRYQSFHGIGYESRVYSVIQGLQSVVEHSAEKLYPL
jgi:hypothetical protein